MHTDESRQPTKWSYAALPLLTPVLLPPLRALRALRGSTRFSGFRSSLSRLETVLPPARPHFLNAKSYFLNPHRDGRVLGRKQEPPNYKLRSEAKRSVVDALVPSAWGSRNGREEPLEGIRSVGACSFSIPSARPCYGPRPSGSDPPVRATDLLSPLSFPVSALRIPVLNHGEHGEHGVRTFGRGEGE